jgi:hypothetical protein
MDINQLIQYVQKDRNCSMLVIEKPAGASWEELLITQSGTVFSWNAIVEYRKNKKNGKKQPVLPEEVRDTLEEIGTREHAVKILTRLIHQGMAYDSEIIPEKEAAQLAEIFISHFGNEARYYSNSPWKLNVLSQKNELSSWDPLTEATFDSGIIIVGKSSIGIAWFEDED